MCSLHGEPATVQDFRGIGEGSTQVARVLTVHVLAELANVKGCPAAAQFAAVAVPGPAEGRRAWENPETEPRGPVSKPAIHRAVGSIDLAALEEVGVRSSRPRFPLARALAANRNAGNHDETVALVNLASGAPLALPGFTDDGGERAAMRDLPELSDIRGTVITVDALRTVGTSAALITHGCGGNHAFTVKGNAPETFGILDGGDRENDTTRHFAEDLDKRHGP